MSFCYLIWFCSRIWHFWSYDALVSLSILWSISTSLACLVSINSIACRCLNVAPLSSSLRSWLLTCRFWTLSSICSRHFEYNSLACWATSSTYCSVWILKWLWSFYCYIWVLRKAITSFSYNSIYFFTNAILESIVPVKSPLAFNIFSWISSWHYSIYVSCRCTFSFSCVINSIWPLNESANRFSLSASACIVVVNWSSLPTYLPRLSSTISIRLLYWFLKDVSKF